MSAARKRTGITLEPAGELSPLEAAAHFCLPGMPEACRRYGNGNINQTYLVTSVGGQRAILQKINRRVYRDVPALMRNIETVTGHLQELSRDPRHSLRLILTRDGGSFFRDTGGEYWRAYEFIGGSVCLERAETAEDLYQGARAFGIFQNHMAGLHPDALTVTVPHFHDTPMRYTVLHEAMAVDVSGRAKDVRPELLFALEREKTADTLTSLLAQGTLPLRIVHNDTKLNNVLLDMATRKQLCVVDLDTVMPGLTACAFGDCARNGASTAPEDESDPDRVSLSLKLFAACAAGFLDACGGSLTKEEIGALPAGARLMALECGVRFLTDYLAGDTYFRVSRPGHNLDRCRAQFRLVKDMENKMGEMETIVAKAGQNAVFHA